MFSTNANAAFSERRNDKSANVRYNLSDAAGLVYGRKALHRKLVVLTFASTACDVKCALRIADLDQTAEALPQTLQKRVAFVAFLVDSPTSPRAKKLFASTLRLNRARWMLLSAAPADTTAIRRGVEVARSVSGDPSSIVALFDASGNLRQRYDGGTLDRGRLAREIAALDSMAR